MKYLFPFLLSAAAILFLMTCEDETPGPGSGDTVPKIAISSVTLFEGNENSDFNFSINTSEASTEEIRFDYATQEVSAEEDTDFIPTSGTIILAPGERNATIAVEIVADEYKESDEQFKVVLSSPVNATLQQAEGVGTIRNDDTMVQVSEGGYSTPENYVGWTNIWSDEFNENAINTANWTHEQGDNGWGNNELQNYTNSSDNSYISDGTLIIEAIESPPGAYTSARMITANKFDFTYGRVDIRAKLPKGQGVWPALWMLGANFFDISWPQCGEIDIMEIVGHEPNNLHGTAHWDEGGYASHTGNTVLDQGDFSDEFHVFTIIWNAQSIDWYLDDEFYHSLNISGAGKSEFQNSFFFIFNIAVGGNWPGNPNASTQFPQRMYVDYIRVFQQN